MGDMTGGMTGDMMGGMMGSMMWMWMIGGLLLITLLIVGIVVLLRTMITTRQTGPSIPLQLLQERFARGEIDRAEYEERATVLTANNQRRA